MPLGGHLWKDTLEKVLLNICSSCKIEKPITEFHPEKKARGGVQGYCKECKPLMNRCSRYGLKKEELVDMIISQAGRCAICRKFEKLSVDHNHKTGKVRELLCGACNSLIGFAEENVSILKGAIKYLRRHQE